MRAQGKVIAICGRIAVGKTWYTNHVLLKRSPNAVTLSADELMTTLFPEGLGTAFDRVAAHTKAYLLKKASELALAGCDVILDWGFRGKEERCETKAFFAERGIVSEWHYIDISAERWQRNIDSRNRAVAEGATDVYPVDQGLLDKLNAHFEVPDPEEIDCWYKPEN